MDWLKLYRLSYGVAQKSLLMYDLGIVHLSLGSPSGGPLQREGWLGTVLAKSQSFVCLYTSTAVLSTAHKQTGQQAETESGLSERWDTGLIPGSQCLSTYIGQGFLLSPFLLHCLWLTPLGSLLFIHCLFVCFVFLLQSQQ